ncbi:MAG: electron transfer flavoprotein subunit beta/FixA family protein [Chlorobi bacterium]|nr:electron transfer flavoprotein subunit beta/FixA family protein [Chlorobiota bacterium]
MKILLMLSVVPDTTSKINFTDNDTKFDKTGIQFVINPHDEFGLTKAMQLKEKHGGELHVVHVGPQTNESVIRKTLAIGADKAFRIDAEPADSYYTAVQLAEFLKDKDYDLIIAGRESIDYNGNAVHGIVAALTGLRFINAVIGLEINGDEVTVDREIEGGRETLQTKLPLLVGGQKGLVKEEELRIPNMRGIMMARRKPLEVLQPVDAPVMTEYLKFEKPPAKSAVKLVDKDNLDQLIDLLHNEAKVI